MRLRNASIVLSMLMVAVLVLSACGPQATEAPAEATAAPAAAEPTEAPAAAEPTEAPKAEEPGQGGTVVLMGHQEVAGLSPDDAGPDVHYVMIVNIHNALLELDPWGELQPVLAESYEVSDDGLTYTFKLREGVKFHDGTEFTAKDVQYTYDYYRDPENATSIVGNFLGVGSIDTPDDYTVVVNMDEVNAAFLMNGATTRIVQSAYHAGGG